MKEALLRAQLAIIMKNVSIRPTMIEHNGFWSKYLSFVQPLSYMEMVVWHQRPFKSGWIWQTAQLNKYFRHNELDQCFQSF